MSTPERASEAILCVEVGVGSHLGQSFERRGGRDSLSGISGHLLSPSQGHSTAVPAPLLFAAIQQIQQPIIPLYSTYSFCTEL